MIRKLKCFFGWHEFGYMYSLKTLTYDLSSKKCKHCGKLRGSK